MVDKARCKSADVTFGRTIMCGEGKSTSRVSVYFSKNYLPWQKCSSVINLPPSSCLITLGNAAVLRAQCLSLLLADWAISSDRSQPWRMEIMQNLHPCHHGHPFVSPLCDDGVTGERGWLVSTHCWLLKFLCWCHSLVSTHITQYLQVFSLSRQVHPHNSFPDLLVTNCAITFIPSLSPSTKSLATAHELIKNHPCGHFCLRNSLSTGVRHHAWLIF